MAWNSKISYCLCLSRAGIKGVCHHTWHTLGLFCHILCPLSTFSLLLPFPSSHDPRTLLLSEYTCGLSKEAWPHHCFSIYLLVIIPSLHLTIQIQTLTCSSLTGVYKGSHILSSHFTIYKYVFVVLIL